MVRPLPLFISQAGCESLVCQAGTQSAYVALAAMNRASGPATGTTTVKG